MRMTTIFIIVAAVLVGMGLASIDPDIEDVRDVLEAFSFDVVVPQLTFSGQATSVFTQSPANPPTDPMCTETDGGDDPYVVGIVMTASPGGTQELVDACDGNVLLEYYCDGMRLHSYKKPCVYGCWQGVCRNVPAQEVPDVVLAEERGIDREDMQTVQRAFGPRWVEPVDIPTCKNGFKDGKETDVDCGGPCKPCSYSQMCKQDTDCKSDLFCNYRSRRCLKTKY